LRFKVERPAIERLVELGSVVAYPANVVHETDRSRESVATL
jgi:hypothetical protein